MTIFFNSIDPSLRKHIKNCVYISDVARYFKVFCMYALNCTNTYDCNVKHEFESPDPRLIEFGNTAVAFLNFDEFVKRITSSLKNITDNNFECAIGKIYYCTPDHYGDLNEFCKPISYEWQNELRIRIYLSCEITNWHGIRYRMPIESTDPLTLDIGDIKDISVQIPTSELLRLELPAVIKELPISHMQTLTSPKFTRGQYCLPDETPYDSRVIPRFSI